MMNCEFILQIEGFFCTCNHPLNRNNNVQSNLSINNQYIVYKHDDN